MSAHLIHTLVCPFAPGPITLARVNKLPPLTSGCTVMVTRFDEGLSYFLIYHIDVLAPLLMIDVNRQYFSV